MVFECCWHRCYLVSYMTCHFYLIDSHTWNYANLSFIKVLFQVSHAYTPVVALATEACVIAWPSNFLLGFVGWDLFRPRWDPKWHVGVVSVSVSAFVNHCLFRSSKFTRHWTSCRPCVCLAVVLVEWAACVPNCFRRMMMIMTTVMMMLQADVRHWRGSIGAVHVFTVLHRLSRRWCATCQAGTLPGWPLLGWPAATWILSHAVEGQ